MASGEATAAPPGDAQDGRAGAAALGAGVPVRGIRMKFAVLAGLVEVGEVSHRDIVETVFNLARYLSSVCSRLAARRHIQSLRVLVCRSTGRRQAAPRREDELRVTCVPPRYLRDSEAIRLLSSYEVCV
ncbi:hypothetical protein F2P81_010122 [Scophthalmus maximus]|uniref:Uncharacterized protein n=1 Tax=Scophthalmus maximus TaxID=52904 RepID=A0A6A4SYX5_SCOMX|nr:hypothetical protein F2P81_010122 [Scophthalmus maximus]